MGWFLAFNTGFNPLAFEELINTVLNEREEKLVTSTYLKKIICNGFFNLIG
jgi:hypothetical protein